MPLEWFYIVKCLVTHYELWSFDVQQHEIVENFAGTFKSHFSMECYFLFSILLVSYLEHTVHRWSCNKEKIRNTCTGSFKLLVRKIFAESVEKVRNWFFLNSFSNYKLIKMILSIFSLLQDLNDVVLAAFLCWITLKHFRGKIYNLFYHCCLLMKL